jgi:hypothetical protein
MLWRSRSKEPARRAAPPPGADRRHGRPDTLRASPPALGDLSPLALEDSLARQGRGRTKAAARRRRMQSIGEGSEGGGVSSVYSSGARRVVVTLRLYSGELGFGTSDFGFGFAASRIVGSDQHYVN